MKTILFNQIGPDTLAEMKETSKKEPLFFTTFQNLMMKKKMAYRSEWEWLEQYRGAFLYHCIQSFKEKSVCKKS